MEFHRNILGTISFNLGFSSFSGENLLGVLSFLRIALSSENASGTKVTFKISIQLKPGLPESIFQIRLKGEATEARRASTAPDLTKTSIKSNTFSRKAAQQDPFWLNTQLPTMTLDQSSLFYLGSKVQSG